MQEKEPNLEKNETPEGEASVEEVAESTEVEEKGKKSSGETELQTENVERVEEKYGQIEVSKIETQEFFAAKEYAKELKKLTEQDYSPAVAMLLFDNSSRGTEKTVRELDEGGVSLSGRARWYIREEAKKQGKDNEREESEDEQKMFLSGREAEQFLQYQKMGYVIEQLREETRELLKHDKDGASEVLTVVSQTENPQDVRKYLNKHKGKLSRKAREFLEASIVVMKKMSGTPQGKNIFRPM